MKIPGVLLGTWMRIPAAHLGTEGDLGTLPSWVLAVPAIPGAAAGSLQQGWLVATAGGEVGAALRRGIHWEQLALG